MSESAPPRVLFCAFAELPGASGTSARTQQWLSVFGNKQTDALCLKGEKDPHIQRLGGARVMRVPNTRGKPFAERLSTYQRALSRQLQGDSYDLIWCADLASAPVIAHHGPGGAGVIIEARGSAVGELAGDPQRRQRDGERALLRSASRVVVPTPTALRAWQTRVEPKTFALVPYCVDRTVFAPPSIELAFDDDARILVFGGREGGPRLDLALAALETIAARSAPTTRLALLGATSVQDDAVRAGLAKAKLSERVELIDGDASYAVSTALALAHVVIVIGSPGTEAEPAVLPHRALEAMACGRALVLAGPEAAYGETLAVDQDAIVVPLDADRIAAAAVGLISQHARRQALMRSAARFVETSADLVMRAEEVKRIVNDACGVRLASHPPRDDDGDTSSSRSVPDARAFARVPPRRPPPATTPNELASPRVPPARPEANIAPPAEASGPESVFSERMPDPSETVRMEAPAFSHLEPPAGLWEGDTFLDSNAAPQTDSGPDGARVKAAMLVSSDAGRSAAPRTLTSVKVASSMDSLEPNRAPSKADPWVNDTIADGSPVETNRVSSERAPAGRLPSAKSLLVDLAEVRSDLAAAELAGSEIAPRVDVTDEEPAEQGTSDESAG